MLVKPSTLVLSAAALCLFPAVCIRFDAKIELHAAGAVQHSARSDAQQGAMPTNRMRAAGVTGKPRTEACATRRPRCRERLPGRLHPWSRSSAWLPASTSSAASTVRALLLPSAGQYCCACILTAIRWTGSVPDPALLAPCLSRPSAARHTQPGPPSGIQLPVAWLQQEHQGPGRLPAAPAGHAADAQAGMQKLSWSLRLLGSRPQPSSALHQCAASPQCPAFPRSSWRRRSLWLAASMVRPVCASRVASSSPGLQAVFWSCDDPSCSLGGVLPRCDRVIQRSVD